MDCATFTLIVTGERSTDLSHDESAAFDAHLDACARCRDALAHAEDELQPLVDRMAPPELPAAQWARVDAAIKAEAAKGVPRERRAMPLFIAIAAAILFTLTVGLLFPLEVFTGAKPVGGSAALDRSVTEGQPAESPQVFGIPAEPTAACPVVIDRATVSAGEKFEADVHYFNEEQALPGTVLACLYVRENL
jgi:hypothetical protein